MGGAATQHAMPPPVQPQWAPSAGYFDPYFASMQQGMTSQIEGLATQMQNQMTLSFQNMQQQMSAEFRSFGQHIHNTMYHPIMTQMRSVQEGLHSDIAVLDTRFDDLPSSDQFEQLEARQQQLQQSLNTFSSTFTSFSDHFYSVNPAPVPPPEFYPHQPFYPPPPPPSSMDD